MPMDPRLMRPKKRGRTLYYNGAVDTDWATLGNWWNDAGHTSPASSLPTSADSVVMTSADIATNSGSAAVVANFTNNSPDPAVEPVATYTQYIPITVTGVATFNGGYSLGVIAGNAVFRNGTYNQGTVDGDAAFNDSSYHTGTVTGSAAFNDTSYALGTVNGNAAFSGSSHNSGTVNGDATFTGSSYNAGTVDGTATFTESACNNGGTAGVFVPDPPPECNL